jgi:acyl-CoA hydrolase
VPETLTPDEAAARLEPTDTLGIPLGTGQPPKFLEALGRRDDWQDLRIGGALLLAWSEAFKHPNVHYLSGFFGPVERALRDQDANVSFTPADFRRFAPLLEQTRPRVVATVAAPPDEAGWCSLSLHSGGTFTELGRAGADPDRLLMVEVSDRFPRTHGLPPEHRHAVQVDRIDVLIESDAEPFALPEAEPAETDAAIADNASRFIPDGATLQTGIGAIPSAIVAQLANGPGGDYGVHSEMFTDGLMALHEAGKVSNRKGQFDGVSVATFAGGSTELYDWLDDNREVAFLPVEVINSPELIGRNRMMVTINAAIAVDVHGQVVADTIHGRQYSGIGGHEDFVSGPALSLEDRSLLCMPSTAIVAGERVSRIVPWFDAGAVITTPRHQVDVIVTEYGVAELQGLTVHQRGRALAAIAHPDYRDQLLEAAARASKGNSPIPP